MIGKIAALAHKLGDHTMETGTLQIWNIFYSIN
jgi:hypothetical protein